MEVQSRAILVLIIASAFTRVAWGVETVDPFKVKGWEERPFTDLVKDSAQLDTQLADGTICRLDGYYDSTSLSNGLEVAQCFVRLLTDVDILTTTTIALEKADTYYGSTTDADCVVVCKTDYDRAKNSAHALRHSGFVVSLLLGIAVVVI